jgi:hypothetical protein
MVLEFLARAIRQEKEIKGIKIGKEKAKLSVFTDNIILFLKDPKNHQKSPTIINTFNKVAEYKINTQKLVAFLYTNNEQTEKQYRETISCSITSKK